MDAEIKILRAKTRLILNHPFFGTLCAGLKIQEDKKSKGMWTDGITAAYNPAYIESKPFDEVVGLMAHIVMHRALGHHKRLKTRDAGLWNAACDYSINWILIESGFTMPEGYLLRDDLKNKSADEIYEILISEKDEKEEKGGSSSDEDSGNESVEQEEKEAENTITSDILDDDNEAGSVEAESSDDDTDEENKGSSGEEGSENSDNDSPEFTGEVREPKQGNDSGSGESDYGDENADTLLSQAFNSSMSEGNLPDSIKRLVKDVLRPRLDWKKMLARFVSSTGRSDYTWTTPNKRFLHTGHYFPGMKSENTENIVIAIDTSGSISDEELNLFTSEISGALGVYSGEIHVLACDAGINSHKKYCASDLFDNFDFKGGGGTDFRPPFDWAKENLSDVRCLVYFTDLCSSRYPDEPDYPVLWITNNENYAKKPPFGEIININEN